MKFIGSLMIAAVAFLFTSNANASFSIQDVKVQSTQGNYVTFELSWNIQEQQAEGCGYPTIYQPQYGSIVGISYGPYNYSIRLGNKVCTSGATVTMYVPDWAKQSGFAEYISVSSHGQGSSSILIVYPWSPGCALTLQGVTSAGSDFYYAPVGSTFTTSFSGVPANSQMYWTGTNNYSNDTGSGVGPNDINRSYTMLPGSSGYYSRRAEFRDPYGNVLCQSNEVYIWVW